MSKSHETIVKTTLFAECCFYAARNIRRNPKHRVAIDARYDKEVIDFVRVAHTYAESNRLDGEIRISNLSPQTVIASGLGIWLDRFYKRELQKFVNVQIKLGQKRIDAVRTFFEINGITENEYAQESAIQRCKFSQFYAPPQYKLKKNPKKTKNLEKSAIGFVPNKLRIYSPVQLEQIVQNWERQNPILILTTKMSQRKILPRNARIWADSRLGSYSNQEIAKKYKLSASAISRAIREFERQVPESRRPTPSQTQF